MAVPAHRETISGARISIDDKGSNDRSSDGKRRSSHRKRFVRLVRARSGVKFGLAARRVKAGEASRVFSEAVNR